MFSIITALICSVAAGVALAAGGCRMILQVMPRRDR